jgi:predicted O-methyltransferase YrrM
MIDNLRLWLLVRRAYRVKGWVRGREALELARAAYALAENPVIVEIGSFLGSSTIMLAGARRLKGSGKVHCIDPFDGSGDAFSVPFYRGIQQSLGETLRARFDRNIRAAGLCEWVEVHVGKAAQIAQAWRDSVDLLFLDGDQSREGVREAYEAWSPFLKAGGVIALHNSVPPSRDPTHDGHLRVATESIHAPEYANVRTVTTTTFATQVATAVRRGGLA